MLGLVLVLLVPVAQPQDLDVSVSNTAMNAVSNYILTISSLKYFVASSSVLALTFPREYPTSTLHSMAPYTGIASDDICGSALCSGITFSFNGSTLFIGGLFKNDVISTGGYYLHLTVFNIKNPPVMTVGDFVMTIFKGTTIYYPLAFGSLCQSPYFDAASLAYSVSVG